MYKEKVNSILEQIGQLQSRESYHFPAGIFASQRSNPIWMYRRQDSNIFATASVAFILKGLIKYLPKYEKEKVEVILNNVLNVFERYSNMHGGLSYNFWQTKPSQHFPGGYLFRHFKHFKLPDDIDDTALVFLVQNRKKEEVATLRDMVIKHSKRLEKDKAFAYNTWFGQKMPKETDVCAISNLLYLFLESKLELVDSDIASISFLAESIASQRLIKQPFEESRHYGTSTLIIYHFARLMGRFEIPELEKQKVKLISMAFKVWESEKNMMNKVLLQTALLRLGEKVDFDANSDDLKTSDFYPFIGAPFAPFSNPVSKYLAGKPWAIINWECEALKLAYMLENKVLKTNLS